MAYMTWSDFFQFCLVLIGVVGLVIEIINNEK